MRVRVLPPEHAPGALQMALDQALLDAVDAAPGEAAWLRTYTWSEPTLSLGYFQAIAAVEADARWRGVPVVRRPSGGGALWHDREVTYAVVVPRSHPLARRPSDLYRAAHGALAARLRTLGWDARRRAEAAPGVAAPLDPPAPFLCFLDRDPEDVVVGAAKVVGGAQRRRPHAVLQHGAIVLARSPRTPDLPGLLDLPGAPAGGLDDPAKTVVDALAEALGATIEPAPWPKSVREAAGALIVARYGDAAWTGRR